MLRHISQCCILCSAWEKRCQSNSQIWMCLTVHAPLPCWIPWKPCPLQDRKLDPFLFWINDRDVIWSNYFERRKCQILILQRSLLMTADLSVCSSVNERPMINQEDPRSASSLLPGGAMSPCLNKTLLNFRNMGHVRLSQTRTPRS